MLLFEFTLESIRLITTGIASIFLNNNANWIQEHNRHLSTMVDTNKQLV